MTHSFQRYTGAGNTFIVMNTWEDPLSLSRDGMELLVQHVCDRTKGPGADGVILINQSSVAPFRMDFYNPDGTTGMLCGNGARCAVRAAKHYGFVKGDETRFEVLGAVNRAELLPNGEIRVHFQDPKTIRLSLPLRLSPNEVIDASYVDLGSQHVVIAFSELARLGAHSIESFDIAHYGAAIRGHADLSPVGANANFVEVREDGEEKYLRIRTFERGVEGETLACGTGCMSAAIVAFERGWIDRLPVRLLTQSEEFVTVSFRVKGGHVSDLTLQGSATPGEQGTLLFDDATGTLRVSYP